MTRSLPSRRRAPRPGVAGAWWLPWLAFATPLAAQGETSPDPSDGTRGAVVGSVPWPRATRDPAGRRAGLAAWQTAALGAATFGGLLLLDEAVRDVATELRGSTGSDLAALGDDYGSWRTTGPILAGGVLALGAALEGDRGVRKAAAAVIGAFAGSMANEALNQTLGRRRPSEELGSWEFDPFHGHASLGSGHAAYAFAVASAVDEITEGWIAIPFYAAAAGTGLSRVYDDRHWLSDVAVGALVGLWIGRRTTRGAARLFGVGGEADRGPGEPEALRSRIEPVAGGSFLGLRIRL